MESDTNIATAVAVYMLLMGFSQRALDQLRVCQDGLPPGEVPGPGFDVGALTNHRELHPV